MPRNAGIAEDSVIPVKTGIELVLGAIVGPGFGMTTGAGLDAVAADLHVPEQGFAQGDGGLLVLNEIRKISEVPAPARL